MKIISLGMVAASALMIGAPAAAQQYNAQSQAAVNSSIEGRIMQLDARIETGIRTGLISRQQAPALRQQMRQLRQLERQYRANGISGQERAILQQRLQALRKQVRLADGGARGRYDLEDRDNGYGNNGNAVTADWIDRNNDGFDDRDIDRDGRWDDDANNGRVVTGDWIDRNNDGFDDRDIDRDGRWDDDASSGRAVTGDWIDQNRDGYDDRDLDRDGRWDDDVDGGSYQQPAQRGILGGILDSVLGRGGLRVGQRATAGLYGLPAGYQTTYRDGNGIYYRTDGRQIYQIDARTQTVVRIYPMNR